MSTEVEKYRPPAVERLEVGVVRAIAKTDLVPKNLRGNVPAIMATILKGRALGLDDMHSLSAIHFIEGKPTLSSETMVLLVRRAGHSIVGDFGDGAVTVRGKRNDTSDEMSVTWTTAMAQRAGLLSKDNWKKYPEAMLWARAASQLCRMLFADVLAGVGYTPEELELSPEEQVSEALGTVNPPADIQLPDDSETADEVVDVEAELVDESAGEPEVSTPETEADSPSVASATPSEPTSPAETASAPEPPARPPAEGAEGIPPMGEGEDGQTSFFAARAEQAQKSRAKQHKDPTS